MKAIDSENRKPSTSTATVTITLLDANDNAPIFDEPKYTFRLFSDPGEVLGQVKVKFYPPTERIQMSIANWSN